MMQTKAPIKIFLAMLLLTGAAGISAARAVEIEGVKIDDKVTLASGGDDTRNILHKQLKKESTKTPNEAAFRWAVTVTDSGRLALQLQSLPLPVATIASKPLLLQDDVAVNVVQSWPISAELFDGENGLSGPVPVLFSDQPEELRTKISDNEDGFFAQLNKFMTK